MNFFKCTFSLISKEWKYHFCLSDWRNLYCVSGFPSHSSGTLLHGFIFHSISSSSTAQLFLKCLSFPFLNEGKKINPIFLWDDLCERLIYIHCLPVLISYSLSLHSFLHLRVTALSSERRMAPSPGSPSLSGQTFWVAYEAASILAFP